jgi:peptidyl-tRNA hydrolase, PTH1 family
MKVIVGLGNPGREYKDTRHNVGFMVLEKIATDTGVGFQTNKKLFSQIIKLPDLILIKPETFMNDSGKAVRAVIDYFVPALDFHNLYVVHDDLDIEIGKTKTQLGKGPKEHNGLQSIYQHLSSDQFWHVRVGVDAREGIRLVSGSDYVLGKLKDDESLIVDKVCETIVDNLTHA